MYAKGYMSISRASWKGKGRFTFVSTHSARQVRSPQGGQREEEGVTDLLQLPTGVWRPDPPVISAATVIVRRHARSGAGNIGGGTQSARPRSGGGVGRRLLVVGGHEAVSLEEDQVQPGVHGQHDEDDQPSGDEVDEQAHFVGREPAP